MTQEQHPITPPLDLVQIWVNNAIGPDYEQRIAIQAARWGADMELEACCEWFSEDPPAVAQGLRTVRRPNWPSLKEQAQRIFVENGTTLDGRMELDLDDIAIIRRALEALPD